MNPRISNFCNLERSVEVTFICEKLSQLPGCKLLDVGGIPTSSDVNIPIHKAIREYDIKYDVCDFRGGKYNGDFVTINIPELYEVVMFLSSLEHFPQCTEGDLVYRKDEDIKGYKKALDILAPKGKILLTVPFGKHRWQPYHQNYNLDGILELTRGSKMLESYTYSLSDDNYWDITAPNSMEEILYTDKAYGVGCFMLEKESYP